MLKKSITVLLLLVACTLASATICNAAQPMLAAGSNFSLMIKSDGTLWAWGQNDFGQLGVGDSVHRDKPVQVGTESTWSMVAAGNTHAIALKKDGTVWGWGQNANGSVGNGTYVQQIAPVQVKIQGYGTPLTNIISISAGPWHSFAVDASGYLWSWGNNLDGQLGDGTTTTREYANRLVGTGFKSVSTGSNHTLAVKSDGTLWAWGNGTSGQLGYSPAQTTPKQLGAETSWSTVAAGNGSSLALKTNGTLWGWGNNYYGQLGLNITLPDVGSHSSPSQEASLSTWAAVKISQNNSVLAIKSDGTLWGWGGNSYYELGLGNTSPQKTPVQISAAATWSEASIGTSHALALKYDGSLFSWSSNYYGALGDGTLNPLSSEGIRRKLPNASGARLAVSDFGGLELKSNGTIWSWGDNSHGMLGDPVFTAHYTPSQIKDTVPASNLDDWVELVCASAFGPIEPNHCIALKRDGTLWTWGYNTYGALGLGSSSPATVRWNPNKITASSPTSTVPWASVSAAPYRSMGIRSDGTLWGWGANESGQMGNSTYDQLELPTKIGPDSNWWRVSISQDHTLAIRTNGELWVWGYNTYGKLGTSTTSSPASPVKVAAPVSSTGVWFAVSAGESHSLGIMSDGTLWAWGSNSKGQLGIGTSDTATHATPVKIGVSTDWIAVSAGGLHSMALKADGTLWMWGDNSVGQFGNGTSDTALHATPVQVQPSIKFSAISTSSNGASVMALTTDGTVKTWGYNSRGQLGDGSTTNRSAPVTPGYSASPSFSSAFLTSDNFDSTKAGVGSTISLSLVASQKITTPRITFNNNPAKSVSSSDGGVNWLATYKVSSTDTEGSVGFKADAYSDIFNPNLAGVSKTATSDLSTVTIDRTPPAVSQVRIASSNSAPTLAKPGDTVTVYFAVSELLDIASVTIAGVQNFVGCPGFSCSVSYSIPLAGSTVEGPIAFSIQAYDLAANASTTVTATSDGSSVTFDKTLPTLPSVTIASNHSPSNIAKINNIVTVSFTSSEIIKTPTVTIAGHVASVTGSGTNWSASYTMQAADSEGSVPFSISFSDLAGNAGSSVTAPTSGSGVIFQKKVLVTIPSVSYGTLNPVTSQWVDYSGGLSITVTPNPGCSLVGISGCNGTLFGNTYDLTSLVDDCAITASFQDPLPPVITITSPSDGATLDSSALQTLTGTVSDPGSGVATVQVQIRDTVTGNYLQQNNTYAASPVQLSATVNGSAWSYATPIGAFADKSTYLLTVFATDAAGNGASSASTFTKVPSYELTKTSIKTLTASQSRIAVGNSIAVNGVIERYSSYNDGFIGKSISLDIYVPGATDPITVNTAITSNSGSFSFANVSTFSVAGSYKITARFPATTWLQASSADIYIQVGPKAGYAIVVQGQVQNDSQGALAYNKTAKRVLDRMKTQGLATDYLNNDPLQPQDVRYFSSLPDRTHEALDKTEIGKAITTWAAQKLTEAPAPLYIVLIDHGSKEPDAKIFLNTQSITPAELSGWLKTLEEVFTAEQLAVLPERVIVIGACYSGAFIDSVSKAGRVVISSATATEESARGFIEGDGLMTGEYFVDQLFARLERGDTFKDAFNAASRDTAMFTRNGTSLLPNAASVYHDTARQHALLDDNGDHTGLNRLPDVGTTEGQLAATIRLGIGRQAQIVPSAEILNTGSTMYLTSLQDGLPNGTYLWAEVNDPALLKVGTYPTVLLRTPDSSATGAPGSQITYSLVEYQLSTTGTCTRSDGTQTACYRTADNQLSSDGFNNISTDMFLNQGIYEAYYYVIDKTTLGLSPIRRSVIYKSDATTVTAPTLSTPLNNSEQKTALAFNWSPVTANGKDITYTLLISSKSDFSVIEGRVEELAENMAMIPLGVLKDLATYYWKVLAIDQFGNKGTSPIRKFTTNNRNGLPAMVKGYVTDSIGTPIEGAEISDGILTATSLPNGAFLLAVDSAVTSLSATASNYSPKQVSVSLTPGGVTEVLFMLTPPVTTHTLTLAINGIGRVYQSPTGLDCYSDNTSAPGCQTTANNGTGFSLLATTSDWRYLFSSWGGVTCSNDITNTATLCTFTLAAPTTVTATFGLNYQARISATPYASLQTALNSAATGVTVEAMAYNFQEPILFNRNGIEVTIDGGRGQNYAIQTAGYSTVNGSFRIQQGTIKVKGPVAIK